MVMQMKQRFIVDALELVGQKAMHLGTVDATTSRGNSTLELSAAQQWIQPTRTPHDDACTPQRNSMLMWVCERVVDE